LGRPSGAGGTKTRVRRKSPSIVLLTTLYGRAAGRSGGDCDRAPRDAGEGERRCGGPGGGGADAAGRSTNGWVGRRGGEDGGWGVAREERAAEVCVTASRDVTGPTARPAAGCGRRRAGRLARRGVAQAARAIHSAATRVASCWRCDASKRRGRAGGGALVGPSSCVQVRRGAERWRRRTALARLAPQRPLHALHPAAPRRRSAPSAPQRARPSHSPSLAPPSHARRPPRQRLWLGQWPAHAWQAPRLLPSSSQESRTWDCWPRAARAARAHGAHCTPDASPRRGRCGTVGSGAGGERRG
jgi:hypothetical protein